jgi:hypothetical protein
VANNNINYISPVTANKFSTPIKNKVKYADYIQDKRNDVEEGEEEGGQYLENQMIKTQSFTAQLKNECEIKHKKQASGCKKKLKIDQKGSYKQELQMKRSKSWDVNKGASTK